MADTLVTLPGPSHWRERLAVAGAALAVLSVVAPWRPLEDGPAGVTGLGRPGLLALGVALALLVVPLQWDAHPRGPDLTVVVGVVTGIGALMVTGTEDIDVGFVSTGRAVALAGAVALVVAGVVRPDRSDWSDCSPSSELQPDDAQDHLTDAEVYRYADRLTDQLPAAESPRSTQLGLVALAGSGLVLALLWVPWNERTIPGPTSDADGVTTGRIGAELLGTGRTLAVLAAVGLAWLVVAAIGIRRAAPALVLAGAVALAAIVHVRFAGVSDANVVPVLALLAAVTGAAAGLALAVTALPMAGRALTVVALLPAVAIGLGADAAGAGRDGPFVVLADGEETPVDGAPARQVGTTGMVAWWDGERPGAVSVSVGEDRGDGRAGLAWSVRDGRVRTRFEINTSAGKPLQVAGDLMVAGAESRSRVITLDGRRVQGCCYSQHAIDRTGRAWGFSGEAFVDAGDSGRYEGLGMEPSAALRAPPAANALFAGDDGPLFRVGSTRLLDPARGEVAFDPRGGCGVPGGGLGADVITELTQVAGDGAGGLWMVATAVPESGEDQLLHLSAGDVVRRISHRVPAVTSIAVSDDGSLLVVSDDRLLVLEDPEDELADLDDGRPCRIGPLVADPLQTRPQEAGDQVNIRGPVPPAAPRHRRHAPRALRRGGSGDPVGR